MRNIRVCFAVSEDETPAGMKARVSVVLLLYTLSGESLHFPQCVCVCVCVCESADDASVFVSELFIYVQEISV